ncbi:MAG: N-acetylglucosamine-6-phosphate deacetylase [Cyanobacteriota bacterium]|nr:N-acetylglucosamine-6-phosphate deacetylase [Cyanobacteriota bacterium]
MKWQIINARVPGDLGLQQISSDDRGFVQKIATMPLTRNLPPEEDMRVIDVAGDWISLGGIDLQINGALGLPFTEIASEHRSLLKKICDFLWAQGVDGFLPTLVTTSIENIHRALDVFSEFVAADAAEEATARILGVHLEGPFLNPQKRGAHPEEFLLPLSVENLKRVLGDYASTVKLMTLAPELDSSGEAIAYLRSLGITVSLGHSLATLQQAQRAFARGASMVTHAFNAMPPLHHRQPGLLGAAIIDPEVRCGLIADGEHVCPEMLQILLQAGQYDRGIFLVSDALAPLGLEDGLYPWDTREIEVKNGTARLLDGTLAGTTRSLLAGAQNLVRWGLCSIPQAIAMTTVAPRQAIGLDSPIGQSANKLLRWKLTQDDRIDESLLTWQRVFSGE